MTFNPFDCANCLERDGTWKDDQRHELRCTRVDYRGSWTAKPSPPMREYLGREPLTEIPAEEVPYQGSQPTWAPYENWAEGCPGGWGDNPFATSFVPYIRQVGDNALPNPRVHADTPDHILEAIEEFESHRRAAIAAFHEEVRRIHG